MEDRSFSRWKWQPPEVPNLSKPSGVMQNRSFPRWIAPVVGVGVGLLISLRCLDGNKSFDWRIPAVGVGAGFLAGLVIWLMDAPSYGQEHPATVIGWILVLLSWLVIVIPVGNLFVSVPAFLVNRQANGWPNKWSRAAIGVSVLVSTLVVVLFVYWQPSWK